MLGPDPVGFGGQWGYLGLPGSTASLLGHRVYDASTGRFLNRDPIGYAGGVNLYGFVGNNPVTRRDPSGLQAEDAEKDVEPREDTPEENPDWYREHYGETDNSKIDLELKIKAAADKALYDETMPPWLRGANAPMQTEGHQRPLISTKLPARVTNELPEGEFRTPGETAQARNFFERNRDAARKWWTRRTGRSYPSNATHDEHPRPLKNGGDPLFIKPLA